MMSFLNTYQNFLNTTCGVFFGSFVWSVFPFIFIVRNSGIRFRRSFFHSTFFRVMGIPLLDIYLTWALANTIKEVFWYDIQFSSSLLLFGFISCIALCFTHSLKAFRKTRIEPVMKITGYVIASMSIFFLYISYKEFINPTCFYDLRKTPQLFVKSIKGAEEIIDANIGVFEESTTFPKFAMLMVMIKACPFAVYTNYFVTKSCLLYLIYFGFFLIVFLLRIADVVVFIMKKIRKTQLKQIQQPV